MKNLPESTNTAREAPVFGWRGAGIQMPFANFTRSFFAFVILTSGAAPFRSDANEASPRLIEIGGSSRGCDKLGVMDASIQIADPDVPPSLSPDETQRNL